MSTNIIFIKKKKKWEDEWIYIIHDIKSLLFRELKIFYLSPKNAKNYSKISCMSYYIIKNL